MTKLDHQGLSRREAKRQARFERNWAEGSASRSKALRIHAKKEGLRCFRCHASDFEVAKIGVSKRGKWAICVPCVQKGRP